MRRMLEKILSGYGRKIVLYRGEESWEIQGFFQSVTGKAERLAQVQPGPLGIESRKQFIYIGPVEPEVTADDVLNVDGKDYLVRSVQIIEGGSGPVYTWAMCVERGGADAWGLNG